MSFVSPQNKTPEHVSRRSKRSNGGSSDGLNMSAKSSHVKSFMIVSCDKCNDCFTSSTRPYACTSCGHHYCGGCITKDSKCISCMHECIILPSPISGINTNENLSPQFDDTMEPASPLLASTPVVRRVFKSMNDVPDMKPFRAPSGASPSTEETMGSASKVQRGEDSFTNMVVSVPKTPNDHVHLLQSAHLTTPETPVVVASAPVWDDYDSAASVSIVSTSSTSSSSKATASISPPNQQNILSKSVDAPLPLQLNASGEVHIRRPKNQIQSTSLDSAAFRAARPTESFSPVFLKRCVSAFDNTDEKEDSYGSYPSPQFNTPDVISTEDATPIVPIANTPMAPIAKKSPRRINFIGVLLAALVSALIGCVFFLHLSSRVGYNGVASMPTTDFVDEQYFKIPFVQFVEPVVNHIDEPTTITAPINLSPQNHVMNLPKEEKVASKNMLVAKNGKLGRFVGMIKRTFAGFFQFLLSRMFTRDGKGGVN